MAMYVDESGPPGAPSIVFLHGGGVSNWMWRDQVAHFCADYHVLTPELPEHGRSIHEKPFTLPDAAKRVADLIRQKATGSKAHLVGLSLGAQTIVRLLADDPSVVERAVISGTLVRPIPGASMVGWMMKLYKPVQNMPFMVRANQRSLGVPDRYSEEFAADTRLLTPDGFAHIMAANMGFKLPDGLKQADRPVLVVVGQKELGAMKASGRDLLAALPKAKGVLAPGVNHNWPLEAPDLFNRLVRAWITDAPLPSEMLPL